MHELPTAARLAAWGSAALEGSVSPDDAADAVAGADDPGHRVSGLPGEDATVNLAYALGRLRALGAHGLRLVLARPGDPGGLPGPSAFSERAVSFGGAVVVTGMDLGLLPVGRAMWSAERTEPDRRTPMSLVDAERALASAMREAADVLDRLDLARWDPAATAVLALRERSRRSQLPATVPAAAHRVVDQAMRISAIVDVARTSDGAAVTAAEMRARTEVLRDLDSAARRAVEAACSAPVA